jgi:gamma-butyrobetaine dioxygenase
MSIHSVEALPHALSVRWADQTVSRYPYLFLRDNCPSAFHPQTQERVFDLLSVGADIAPRSARLDDGSVIIDWTGSAGHRSVFSAEWLNAHRPGRRASDPADIASASWDSSFLGSLPRFGASAIAGGSAHMLDWLKQTKRFGLSLVTGIGDSEESGVALGKMVGFLRRTNFGETFRVETKPDPNNLAYTSQALALHTDLPNQELPPGFQFLHCVRNDAEGGGSVFADSFRIAESIRSSDPEAFRLLSQIPIPYRFHDKAYDIRVHRPLIGLDERGALFDVRYSAHLMDAFDMEAGIMADYYRAFRLFMLGTRDPANIIAFKLNAGEMVVFDNRRVLHGRQAFNPAAGHRLLRGFYVDRGEYDSRIRMLAAGGRSP